MLAISFQQYRVPLVDFCRFTSVSFIHRCLHTSVHSRAIENSLRYTARSRTERRVAKTVKISRPPTPPPHIGQK